MTFDEQIEREFKPKKIKKIAEKLGIKNKYLTKYGNHIAKCDLSLISKHPKGKLILVTAINPTPFGEGKTTTSIGLADGLRSLGENAVLALREPSLGPVFGLKGGACGGGFAQVVPMQSINMHFTGDFHAITAANNLLVALIEQHLFFDNALNIDPATIQIKRCLDVNDRSLRKINQTNRQTGFEITAASEMMAIFCLANDIHDLKEKVSNILVGYNFNQEPIFVKDLQVTDAIVSLLTEAIKPNLVQTLYQTPVFIHGGPFANIAHGCNSLIATKMALSVGDFVITEAGFGADLGAEKFIDIKSRLADLDIVGVVFVITINALKHHGQGSLIDGLEIVYHHQKVIEEIYQLPIVVAINKFPNDLEEDMSVLKNELTKKNISFEVNTSYLEGPKGSKNLAKLVLKQCKENKKPSFVYEIKDSIEDKITKIAQKVYKANGVVWSDKALGQLMNLKKNQFTHLPICMVKTPYSLSDNEKWLNVCTDFNITIKDLQVRHGAGFVVAYTQSVVTMPGLNREPNALKISVSDTGEINGIS